MTNSALGIKKREHIHSNVTKVLSPCTGVYESVFVAFRTIVKSSIERFGG